jgi:hypothetical protein
LYFLCCSMYFLCCVMYFLCCSVYFCFVLCIVCFVSFSVLFVCICVLNYCHRVQLNTSYRIISYHRAKNIIIYFVFIVIKELYRKTKTVLYLWAWIKAWYEYKDTLFLPFSQFSARFSWRLNSAVQCHCLHTYKHTTPNTQHRTHASK